MTDTESFLDRIGQQSEVTSADRSRLIKLAGFNEYSFLVPMDMTESQFLFITAYERVAELVAKKLTNG